VLDSYFKLANKFISFTCFDTTYTIFYHLVVAYFFGHPVETESKKKTRSEIKLINPTKKLVIIRKKTLQWATD